jgi:hypothetical protein
MIWWGGVVLFHILASISELFVLMGNKVKVTFF